MVAPRSIAYFSMEIGITEAIPTYSGGLGMLAGDTLKAGADLGVPMVGVTLLARQGYFRQHLDKDGNQSESPASWDPRQVLGEPLPQTATVTVEGRAVTVRAWQHTIVGSGGSIVPVLFLDTDVEGNATQDRSLTNHLYGGESRYRIAQEIVLGIGGMRILNVLGYANITHYHMNEGHAAFLALELLQEIAKRINCDLADIDACIPRVTSEVRKLCVFTTHTPVAAGHDRFPYSLVEEVLGNPVPIALLRKIGGQDELNMTFLALNLSHYVNSVARQHQHVSTHLFPGFQFSSITNGVHSQTWTCQEFQKLYDKYAPHWRQDSFDLRNAIRIPDNEVWDAHQSAKRRLFAYLNEKYHVNFDENIFTIGFARRATPYKRMDLLFHNIPRIKQIGQDRKIQFIFAGKAHPQDMGGKDLIRKIHWHMGEVRDVISCVYLEEYDMALAKLLIPGVDIWLNTPARPREASGTSGMKAAHNGVPHISIQDGWWLEGHIEGITGWEIGPFPTEENENTNDDTSDAEELYDKLQYVVLPMYYDQRSRWLQVMKGSIAFNASFFNTHRMMQQYVLNAYLE